MRRALVCCLLLTACSGDDGVGEVPAPAAVVWQLLADPYAVVGCVPGAA